MLQKQENKQHQDLIYKSHCAREEQERKFELDMQVIKTENKNIKSLHFEYVLKCRNKKSINSSSCQTFNGWRIILLCSSWYLENTALLDCLQKCHELYYFAWCIHVLTGGGCFLCRHWWRTMIRTWKLLIKLKNSR